MTDATPELYADWLKNTCEKAEVYSDEENYVFINAWNEWAEGAILEPCTQYGYEHLTKTKEALDESR
jgi:hypothetical protein